MRIDFDIHTITRDRLFTSPALSFMHRLSADLRFVMFVSAQMDEAVAVVSDLENSTEAARLLEDIPNHIKVMLEMFYCRCVDNFLTYVSDLLGAILKVQPAILASTEKITTERILRAASLEEVINELIDEQVASLSHKGFTELSGWFNKRGIRLCAQPEDVEQMIKAIAYRNLVVHNRCRVDSRFSRIVPDANKTRGEQVEITFGEIIPMVYAVGKTVSYVDSVASRKFGLPTSSEPA